MKQPLIIIGAGGFAKEVFSWIDHQKYHVLCFYTEDVSPVSHIYNVPVVSDLSSFKWSSFIIAIGDNDTRRRLFYSLTTMGFVPAPPIIHQTVTVGYKVEVGFGSIVCPGCVLTTDIRIGSGCIVNIGSTVGHDTEIGDFVNVAPGVNISGNVIVEDAVMIGTNAAIKESVHIGERSTIGMGSVVLKDVESGDVVAGNPARQLHIKALP